MARILEDRVGAIVRLTPAVTAAPLDAAALHGDPEYLPELARIMTRLIEQQQRQTRRGATRASPRDDPVRRADTARFRGHRPPGGFERRPASTREVTREFRCAGRTGSGGPPAGRRT